MLCLSSVNHSCGKYLTFFKVSIESAGRFLALYFAVFFPLSGVVYHVQSILSHSGNN